MKKKIVFLLFVLCLIKLYHIADRSLSFSPNLLINSFKPYSGEKSSLGIIGVDIIPIRDFFQSQNILEFQLSEEIIKKHEIVYQRIIEFIYPIKMKQNATILVALKAEQEKINCKFLNLTKNFNIYECK